MESGSSPSLPENCQLQFVFITILTKLGASNLGEIYQLTGINFTYSISIYIQVFATFLNPELIATLPL